MDKNRRVIWTNNDYDKWVEAMKEEYGEDYEYTEEQYGDDCAMCLDIERGELDKEVDGYIICIGHVATWRGTRHGVKTIGDNVRDILKDTCGDFVTWYCDRFTTLCEDIHHDGTNTYEYRVAKDKDTAERMVESFANGDLSEDELRKRTKSLRPYIASVYGW